LNGRTRQTTSIIGAGHSAFLVDHNRISEVEMMISKLFDRPVYLKEQKNLVREITAVEEAIDYLEDWPERERDLIHEAALRTCYMAHDGLKPLRAARDAIRSFAKKKGILAKEPAVKPWMIRPVGGSGRASL
jgi:hypothetical protein